MSSPEPLPAVTLKIERRSNHPWIFQKMVEKPAARPKPGAVERRWRKRPRAGQTDVENELWVELRQRPCSGGR